MLVTETSPETREWPGTLEYLGQCPVCTAKRRELELDQLSDVTFGLAPGKWTLWRCIACGILYLDPRPDEASIHFAYGDYYTHEPPVDPQPKNALSWWRSAIGNGYRNWLLGTKRRPALAIGAFVTMLSPNNAQRIRRESRGLGAVRQGSRRLLDVGCGNGAFLSLARQLGWDGYGIDSDTTATAVASKHGQMLGSRIQDIEDSYSGFFDAVTLSHVIEHVHEPLGVLRSCYRVLRPGGFLWLETPNCHSVGYALFGRHWRGLECPRHLTLFHLRALHSCLSEAGFVRIETNPTSDVTVSMFTSSELAKSGDISERSGRRLPDATVLAIKAAVRNARAIVSKDADRSEFVSVVGYRPA